MGCTHPTIFAFATFTAVNGWASDGMPNGIASDDRCFADPVEAGER